MHRCALLVLTLLLPVTGCGDDGASPDAERPDAGGRLDAGPPGDDAGPPGDDAGSPAEDAGMDAAAPDAGRAAGLTACPDRVVLELDSERSSLDIGWLGNAHDMPLPTDNVLTFEVSDCENPTPPCGRCTVRGPVENLRKADNQRCRNRPWLTCDSDAECPSSTCEYFFGAPVPFGVSGTPACTTSIVTDEVVGELYPDDGAFRAAEFDIETTVYTGNHRDPCPVCLGDDAPWDGVLGGTCRGGARDGQPCDVSSRSAQWGETSFDCPPSPAIGFLQIPLGPIGTDTVTWEIDDDNPTCGREGDGRCHVGRCQMTPVACRTDDDCALEPGDRCIGALLSRPSSCPDDCVPDPDDPDEATCGAIADGRCEDVPSAFCLTEADCGPSVIGMDGGRCVFEPRSCFGERITARGRASAPVGNRARSRVATNFVAPFSTDVIASAIGLPGPGRLWMEVLVDFERVAP